MAEPTSASPNIAPQQGARPRLLPLSALVLARNEEANLHACLENICSFVEDVVVLDSYSADRTVEIAGRFPCRVLQHEFLNFAEQRNWALRNIHWRHEWLLTVDADETFPEELIREIGGAIRSSQYDGYFINRRYIFLGRWIRHGAKYPLWTIRLFRIARAVHEDRASTAHALVDGPVGYLKHDIRHEDRKSLYYLIDRHNKYSTADAQEMLLLEKGLLQQGVPARFFGNSVERRRAIKEKIWPRLPFKPLLLFLYQYFFRLGFLDGYPGAAFCLLMAIQVFHTDIKLYEMRQRLARGEIELDRRNVFPS